MSMYTQFNIHAKASLKRTLVPFCVFAFLGCGNGVAKDNSQIDNSAQALPEPYHNHRHLSYVYFPVRHMAGKSSKFRVDELGFADIRFYSRVRKLCIPKI
jgi:hypothetical protein